MSSLYKQNERRHLDSRADKGLDVIYTVMLSLEALIALRWIWLTLGTHSSSLLSSLISKLSAPFAAPFSTFFKTAEAEGLDYIFDFHPLVTMVFYGLMGLLLGQVLRVVLGDRRP